MNAQVTAKTTETNLLISAQVTQIYKIKEIPEETTLVHIAAVTVAIHPGESLEIFLTRCQHNLCLCWGLLPRFGGIWPCFEGLLPCFGAFGPFTWGVAGGGGSNKQRDISYVYMSMI